MEEKILLEIVTPDRLIVSEEAEEINAPGSLGDFGVLPGHTPFLTTLRAGEISYKPPKGERKYFSVSWGYAEVSPDKMIILADAAEKAEEIDLERAQKAIHRAEERLKSRVPDTDIERAEAALGRALARIQVAARKR